MSASNVATSGAHSLSVKNPDGTISTLEGAFAVNIPQPPSIVPLITSITPETVTQGASGVSFKIIGANFQQGLSVSASGTGLTFSVSSVSANEIDGAISASTDATLGFRNIQVTNNPGTTLEASTSEANAIFVFSSPTSETTSLAKIVPNNVYAGTRVKIAIDGLKFPYPLGGKAIEVSFNNEGIAVSNIEVYSDSQIFVYLTLSSQPIGTHDLLMTIRNVSGAIEWTGILSNALTVLAAPSSNTASVISQNPWNPNSGSNLTLAIDVRDAGNYRVIIANPEGFPLDQKVDFIAGTNKFIVPSNYTEWPSGMYKVMVFRGTQKVGTYKLMVFNGR